jgi:hypothetical protein
VKLLWLVVGGWKLAVDLLLGFEGKLWEIVERKHSVDLASEARVL